VEANVYVWRYALLVVHARKEEEEEEATLEITCLQAVPAAWLGQVEPSRVSDGGQ